MVLLCVTRGKGLYHIYIYISHYGYMLYNIYIYIYGVTMCYYVLPYIYIDMYPIRSH